MLESRSTNTSYHRTQAARGASELYLRARSKARRGKLWSWLTGHSRRLVGLAAVESECTVQGRTRCPGTRTVSIRDIRGSEGRCGDFDADFRPLQGHTRDRWVGIASAREMETPLPPVKLVQIGDLYFVRDGHHRISVARAMGQEAIEAEVIAWQVVGPLPWERTCASMTIGDLYEEFEGRLRRYAMSLAHDSDRADDLVQETLIRAMAHLDLLAQLKDYQRRAWLYRVLKNLFIDEQRTRQRQQALLEQLTREDPEVSYSPPEMMSPGVFELVPARYRELLHQRYVLGMNSTEISRELGIPAATIRSRLHLAIKWLRAHQSEFL